MQRENVWNFHTTGISSRSEINEENVHRKYLFGNNKKTAKTINKKICRAIGNSRQASFIAEDMKKDISNSADEIISEIYSPSIKKTKLPHPQFKLEYPYQFCPWYVIDMEYLT